MIIAVIGKNAGILEILLNGFQSVDANFWAILRVLKEMFSIENLNFYESYNFRKLVFWISDKPTIRTIGAAHYKLD